MNRRIVLTIFHDLIVFVVSFFISLWLRLEFEPALNLFSNIWIYSVIFSILNITMLNFMGLYHGIWRYASIHEINSIVKSVSISTLTIIVILFLITRLENIPRSFPILLLVMSVLSAIGPRLIYRIMKDNLGSKKLPKISTLLVGDYSSSENFIRHTKTDKKSPYKIIAIISNREKSVGRRIHNIPIIGSLENFEKFNVERTNKMQKLPERIIISDQNLKNEKIEKLYIFAKKNGLAIGQINKVSNLAFSENKFDTSPIVIEDVLGRKQNVNDTTKLNTFQKKTILITGAGGSIGSELSRQISRLNPKKLILLDNNEFGLFKISGQLENKCISSITDVRDEEKVIKLLKYYKPNYIFHAAALKHITFVEDEPEEALKTNFLATVNLCQLSIKYNVEKMIFISTDKAVYPSNIMGATKRLCEKYIQEISKKNVSTNFSIVRFGNVLGSTGSVVPIFEDQINSNKSITITHPEVKRYFMTIREAVELVLISSQIKAKRNGEIFILEMGEPVLITDLAKKMINLYGKSDREVKIEFTGLRKGEKLNEELYFQEEKIIKTSVEGILCTTEYPFSSDIKKLEKFASKIKNHKIKNALNDILELLPEFTTLKL